MKKIFISLMTILMCLTSFPILAEDTEEHTHDNEHETTQEVVENVDTSTEEVILDEGTLVVDETHADVEEKEIIYYCNKEEHNHGEECFDNYRVLICDEDHKHEEECFKEYSFLLCEKEEHIHDENCLDENYEEPIVEVDEVALEQQKQFEELLNKALNEEEGYFLDCEKVEHTHTSECFEYKEDLICEKEEILDEENENYHVHTDECFEKYYAIICEEKEEHVHTIDCISQKEIVEEDTSEQEIEEIYNFTNEPVTIAESVSEPLLMKQNLMSETLDLLGSALPQDVQPSTLPITVDGVSIEKATMRWLSKSTGSNEQAKFNDLVLVPSGNVAPNQQWQLDFSLSGKGTIDTGDLEIVIPAYIWKDRNGNEPGRLTLAIPEEPAHNGDFAWKRVDDTYVITNVRRISAGSKYMIQGTFRMTYPDPNSDKPFTSTPTYLMNDINTVDPNAEYTGVSDWLYANIMILTPTNQEELSATTNLIRATIDTKVEATVAQKKVTESDVFIKDVPINIPSNLLPANPEDYYYVRWYIAGEANGNQPYTMKLVDNLTDEHNGILLGFESGNNQIVNARDGSVDIYQGFSFNSVKSTRVWTAYPKSAFPNEDTIYTVTNNLTVEVRGVDDEVLSTKTTSASAKIRKPATYHINKVWEYNADKYETDLETIMSRRPSSVRVYLTGISFSDYLSESNNWHTEYVDNGTGAKPSDAYESLNPTGVISSERVYYPDGSYSVRETRWSYVLRKKDYNAQTKTWTFYNEYVETSGVRYYRYFNARSDKYATNHTNQYVRSLTDKDLVLLRNLQETTDITYSVHRSLSTINYTAKNTLNFYNDDNLHQNTVRLEIEDHSEYLNGVKLNENDYYFVYATLPNPSAYFWSGSDRIFSDANSIVAEMYGKVNSEWIKFAEIDENGQITPFNDATIDGNKVVFPGDNVLQTKLVTRTDGDWLSASYNVGLRIKPSENVVQQVEDEFSLSDYIMMNSRNEVSFKLYNDSTDTLLNTTNDTAVTYLHGRNYRLAVDLDKSTAYVKNDRSNRQLVWKNTITLNRVSTIPNLSEFNYAVSENMFSDSKSGVFYDLLPAGMRVDESSLRPVSNVNIKNVNIIENYKDSGRQLLIIEADLNNVASVINVATSSNKYNDETHPCYRNQTVYGWSPSVVSFEMTYSYDEAKNRGLTDLRNHAAYIADEQAFGDVKYWSGENDIPNGQNHKETLGEVREDARSLMSDLSESNSPNTVYAGAALTLSEVDFSALTNIVKQVSITGSDAWSYGFDNEANVSEGGKYSYRITLTSGTDTTTKDIIILDSLENYVPIKVTDSGDSTIPVGRVISQREFNETNELLEINGENLIQGEPAWSWQGYFRGIDISEITSLGVDAKVYYSTIEGLDITAYNPESESEVVPEILLDTSVWSLTPPLNPSSVTAIAIDCRKAKGGADFELKSDESLIAYVHMKAPTYSQDPDAFGEDYKDFLQNAHAFNNVFMDITQIDDLGLTTHSYDHFDFTQVGIYGMDVKVKKVWDDQNDNDRVRPEEIEVELLANDESTGKTLTLNSQGNWEGVFEHVLEFDDNDNRINYSIAESVEEYTPTIKKETTGNLTTITITNKHELFKTDYQFTKVWVSEEADGWQANIPSSIVVRLLADGVFTGKTQTVRPDSSGNWSGTFTNLQKIKDGVDIEYSVEEVPLSSDWITEYEGNQIRNTYYPYGDLIVKKQVINSTPESKDNLFKFTISLKDKNNEYLIDEYNYTIFNENNEEVSTGTIKNGDEFELKENWLIEIKDIPSGSRYELSEENKAGYILSSKTNFSNTINAAIPQESVFTNTYNTTGSISITANKTLSGRDITRNQFRFEIYDAEDKLIRTAGNTAEGLINFGSFTYGVNDNGKEFVYTVKEIDRGRPGYTYDDSVYTVKVYPVDNGNGTMTVTQNIFKNDVEAQSIDFANEYHAEGEITLRAWKELEVRKLQNEEFEFELLNKNAEVIDTKKNTADGSIIFDVLHFDETDIGKTYHYAVREKLGDDPTVNYDRSVFGYALTVLDNGNGTLSISQGTATPIFGEFEEIQVEQGDVFAKYAVSIWGIEQDTLKDGSTAGLTFGPAIGKNYINSYKSHTPSGVTLSGNPHRCVHNDDWNNIIYWNNIDPYVYEQCVAENCTHSVELYEAGETIVNSNFEPSGSGDGPSALFQELLQYNGSTTSYENLRWHPNNNMPNDTSGSGTNYGGWGASRVRAMLNGTDELTDIGDGSGTDIYAAGTSSDIHKSASIYTNTNNLLVCFPEELQAAIGKRATKYDSVYNSKTEANLKTSYDKLWLLSPSELNYTGTDAKYQHPLEGTVYQKIVQNSQGLNNNNNNYYKVFTFDSNTGSSSSTNPWWLRSSIIYPYGVLNVSKNGTSGYYGLASSYCRVSPAFSLDRRVTPYTDGPPIIGWETEDAELPIFRNTLKDGSLTISKLVENEENANPDQEFKFKIKLIGPGIENKQFEWNKGKLPYNAYLIYDANGGEYSDGATENKFTYLVNNNVSSLTNGEYEEPTREGYKFEGWFEDEEFSVKFTGEPEELSLLEDKKVYAKWEKVLPTTKYAVQIYGIEQDTLEDGSTAGLTFGPALGQDFMNTYISHTPTGNTALGNAHRCIHNDDWETIVYWNKLDPAVYEQCIAENCTHSVNLTLSDTLKNPSFVYGGSPSGDGVGALYYEFTDNTTNYPTQHLMWNPLQSAKSTQYGTNEGGWGASRIRAMLNGADSLTTTGDNYGTYLDNSSYYRMKPTVKATDYTGSDTLLSAFPQILQDNIGARKTLYDSVYSSRTTANLKTTYDKLWLLSPNEMTNDNATLLYNGSYNYFQHPLESNGGYQKFLENSQYIKGNRYNGSSNIDYLNDYFKAYRQYRNTSTTGANIGWWLRSSSGYGASYVLRVNGGGDVGSGDAYSIFGVSPCFALKRQATSNTSSNHTNTKNQLISNQNANAFSFDVHNISKKLSSVFNFNNTVYAEDDEIIFENGEAEVTLKKNEKIAFNNIPAGTAYQVWEETPDGWVLIEQRNVSGEIMPLETSEAEFKNRYQPGTTSVQFNGTKLLDNIAAEEGSFSFELYEGEELLETVSVLDGGFIQFSVLSYTETGTHNYTIKEVNPNSDTIDFDTHIENITVFVRDNGDGTLSSEVTYDEDGIVFRNSTRPGTLEIKKNVDISTNANKDDVFTFEIEFTNENGVPLSGDENIYWYRKDANGNIIDDVDLLGRIQAFFSGRDTKLNSSPIGQESFDNENNTNNEENTSAVNEEGLLERLGLVKRVFAEDGDIASGTYDNVDWRITAEGELIIGKEGEVQEFTYRNSRYLSYSSVYPWYSRRDSINSIRFVGVVKGNGSMESMFSYSRATSLDLSNFDTSNVTNMRDMFSSSAATTLDLSNFNTSNVTSMTGMFYGSRATSIIFPNNFGSAVTDMATMFYGSRATTLDLSSFNTSKVTNMGWMFDSSQATSLDLSSFDTSNVTSMYNMFYHSQATSLDLSSFDTSKTTSTHDMFAGNNLKEITIGEDFFASSDIWFPSALAASSNYYTGKWIKSDGSIGPYTSLEIKQYFSQDLVGTWVLEISHINFDANGGYILPEYQTVYSDKSLKGVLTPSENAIHRPYYKFKGWSKTAQGTVIAYQPGSIVPDYYVTDSPTLYAVWEYDGKNQINVNYHQETVDSVDYSLVETDVIRDIPGTEYSPELKSYPGFHTISSVETITVDDEDLTTVNYYYDRDRYTVNFNGNNSDSGQMLEAINSIGGASSTLLKNTFSKKGSIFTGWNTQPDGSGTTYLDQAEVLNLGGHNETVTLYAQWSTNDTSVAPNNGKILVQCKAGETIVIPDLPYGTKYTIKEVNLPEGWSFDSSTGEIGSIGANTVSSSQFNNKYSAEGSAFIIAHKTINGDTPQEGQFTFELYQGSTLLQSKTNGNIDTNEEIPGNNDENISNPWVNTAPVEFDALQFTQEDIGKTFTYTIKEVNSGDNRINYDTHSEIVRITVSDAGDGNLDCNVIYDSNGSLFTNSLKSSSLQLKKNIVNPTQISEETEFNFTINLKDSAGNPISGEYPVKIKHKNYGIYDVDIPDSLYSHTSNIDDTGKQNGNYSNSLNTNEVISIPNAANLIVDVYYNGESTSYDWLSVWKGNYPAYTAGSNATSTDYITTNDGAPSNTNKFGGSQSGSYTVNGNNLTNIGYMRLTIPGDSVTFGFKSDRSGAGKGYGYYAIVTPQDENGNPLTRTIQEEQGFSETTISDGGTLTLKGGEELEITGLPDGATYEIVELDSPGWEITNKAGETGQIVAGETAFVEFENTYSTQGSFEPTANKVLIGGDLSEESFEFVITDENGNEISKAQSDENGLVSFAPIFYDQDDDGKIYAYYIKEVIDEERKDVIWDEHLSEVIVKVEDNGEGELIATPIVTNDDLEFTNIIFSSIEVSKEVSGNLGNKTEEFNFSIEFDSEITNDITFEKYEGETKVDEGTVELTDNTYNFTLKHNESIKLNQIPKNTKYTLSEENYHSEGYTTYLDGKMKRSVTNILKEDTKHSFENSLSVAVPTEIRIYWLSGCVPILLAAIWFVYKKKKIKVR